MDIKTWYKGLTIPSFKERGQMETFATSMLSTFSITTGKALDIRPTFFLSDDVETAAINLKEMKVLIGKGIISEDRRDRPNPFASEEQALTTIFGMMFHESMHFTSTSRNIEEIASKLDLKNPQLYFAVNNVMEDYYIDDVFIKTMEQYLWTYEARYDYFFSLSSAEEKVNEMISEPSSANMLSVLIAMKNPHARYQLRRLAEEHKQIARLALSVIDEHDREARPLLAYEVYKLLLDNTEESSQKEIAEASGESDDAIIDEETMSSMDQKIEITDEMSLCPSSGEYNTMTVEIVPSESDVIHGYRKFIGADCKIERKMTIDKRYNDFAKLLKAQSESSTMWTPPSHRGRHIRTVSRIATDSKIFSNKIVEQGLGPQEIIFLLDCSGSMTDKQNMWKAIEAAVAAAASLENARHSVAVYGHTADHDIVRSFASTTLYRFKSFSESFASVTKRFEHFFANAYDYMFNNDDEMAITEVAKRFTKVRNSKTLIVISDGSPAAYRDPDVRSTAKAVAKVRASGIKVISISISKDAVDPNNRIYGVDNNVDNNDVNVVIDVIRKIAHF